MLIRRNMISEIRALREDEKVVEGNWIIKYIFEDLRSSWRTKGGS